MSTKRWQKVATRWRYGLCLPMRPLTQAEYDAVSSRVWSWLLYLEQRRREEVEAAE